MLKCCSVYLAEMGCNSPSLEFRAKNFKSVGRFHARSSNALGMALSAGRPHVRLQLVSAYYDKYCALFAVDMAVLNKKFRRSRNALPHAVRSHNVGGFS